MKYIIFLVFIIIQLVLKAQPYHPIIGNSYYLYYPGQFSPGTVTYSTLIGDTILNGKEYKRYDHGAIVREDTLTRALWQYDSYYGQEDILYDFNWEVGDSVIYNSFSPYQYKYYITKKDTINTILGPRIRLELSTVSWNWGVYKQQIIEGIGSLGDPFEVANNAPGVCSSPIEILCAYDSSNQFIYDSQTTIYIGASNNPFVYNDSISCSIINNTKHHIVNNSLINLNIYSTPEGFESTFTLQSTDNVNVNLYNLLGQTIQSKNINVISGVKNELRFQILTPGVYIMNINNKELMFSKKIAIQ